MEALVIFIPLLVVFMLVMSLLSLPGAIKRNARIRERQAKARARMDAEHLYLMREIARAHGVNIPAERPMWKRRLLGSILLVIVALIVLSSLAGH